MAQAETQANMEHSDLTDYTIAILGALVFGATVGTTVFWLIAGYEFVANEFLNIYPPDSLLAQQIIQGIYTWSPVVIGALSTIPAYRFLMKLK